MIHTVNFACPLCEEGGVMLKAFIQPRYSATRDEDGSVTYVEDITGPCDHVPRKNNKEDWEFIDSE